MSWQSSMCVVYGTWITDFHIEQQFVQRSIGIITCSFLGDLSFFRHFHLILLTTLTHLVYQRLQFLQWCGFIWLLEMFISHHLVVLGWNASTKMVPFNLSLAACLAAFLLLLVSFLVYEWILSLVFWLFFVSSIFLLLLLLLCLSSLLTVWMKNREWEHRLL